jgi:hypothetical protein
MWSQVYDPIFQHFFLHFFKFHSESQHRRVVGKSATERSAEHASVVRRVCVRGCIGRESEPGALVFVNPAGDWGTISLASSLLVLPVL